MLLFKLREKAAFFREISSRKFLQVKIPIYVREIFAEIAGKLVDTFL
jgi:hypothetical protein